MTAPAAPRSWCRILAWAVLIAVASPAAAHLEVPGRPPQKPIALCGGTIHTISGPDLENATLLFSEGRIAAVGKEVALPEHAERIDISGKHLYPGLIEAHSAIGLVEIDAVRATLDLAEPGRLHPDPRAQVAINPDSELIPVARAGGVLLAVSVPQGTLMTGQSALIMLDGWTWEEMTLRAPMGMHLRWPAADPVLDLWMEEKKKADLEERERILRELEQAMSDARSYLVARKAGAAPSGRPHPLDSRWEPMIPVLEGKLPLFVEADGAQEIQAAIAFCRRHGLKMVLVGGYDAPRCAELLKESNIPVVIGGVHRLPRRRHEAYDTPFTLPVRLGQTGIRYCISGSRRFHASNVRNLSHHAATAVAFGLPPAEGLKAVTLSPAEILGVADRVGSLDPDKDATLIVTDGDILEVTSRVEMAFIQGRRVDLSNRQTRLWNKYRQRYED